MSYIRAESRVIYKSKDGKNTRQFDAVDFIASLCSHIPNKGKQTVRYLGYYSNVCRGKRKKQNSAEADFIIFDDEYTKGCNKSWARLIKKIYEVDPLICPKCGGQMRIIAFIEDRWLRRYWIIWVYMNLEETSPHPEHLRLLIHLMTGAVMII